MVYESGDALKGGPRREQPPKSRFILLQNFLCNGQKLRVCFRARAHELKPLGSAFLPVIHGSLREVRARIIEFENLAIIFSLTRHLFGPGLAEADSMAGAAARGENGITIIAKVIDSAAGL